MDFKKMFSSLVQNSKLTKDQLRAAVTHNLIHMGLPASVAAVIGELVTGLVMMFVGLFMVDAVFAAIALNNTSVFWGTSVALVSLTATVFSVFGLLIIVVALATAIGSLKSMF